MMLRYANVAKGADLLVTTLGEKQRHQPDEEHAHFISLQLLLFLSFFRFRYGIAYTSPFTFSILEAELHFRVLEIRSKD